MVVIEVVEVNVVCNGCFNGEVVVIGVVMYMLVGVVMVVVVCY